MEITCTKEDNGELKKWIAKVKNVNINPDGSEFELKALGYSFHIITGTHAYGRFVCIPDWDIGCELATYDDVFWNTERLTKHLSEDNAITVASAIKEIGAISQLISNEVACGLKN